ncbi:MAG: hypothetical protein A3G24_19725 [Betaproteobacteria bacterium RIFCSPLOWO2_12_FULL_62_13]|nr:MAG: hypothetical protein A3G24_19725 [Betaproteobacteria bacterium RIFCSPLOWO2_12_FULL_62_13]
MNLTRNILLVGCLLMRVTTMHAAAPDKMVLGVELGARFLVPTCSAGEISFSSRLCFNGALINHKAWGADEYYVSLPSAGTPPYVRGELRVSVVNGIVESVQIGTWGIQAQGGALAALTKQYGEPTRARKQMQNALRSRFPTRFAEWDLRDFSVKFDGTTGSIDWGRIEVTTHRYRKLVKDYEQRSPADSSR